MGIGIEADAAGVDISAASMHLSPIPEISSTGLGYPYSGAGLDQAAVCVWGLDDSYAVLKVCKQNHIERFRLDWIPPPAIPLNQQYSSGILKIQFYEHTISELLARRLIFISNARE
jgi:hypothetical protein